MSYVQLYKAEERPAGGIKPRRLREEGDRMTCKPDSSGANWFRCHRGTVGCPRIHDGLTPHCIACAAGERCRYGHEPPVLEMTAEAYREFEARGDVAQRPCPDCDGTGEVWESCGCYQCEYSGGHDRYVPCGCGGRGFIDKRPAGESNGAEDARPAAESNRAQTGFRRPRARHTGQGS